MVRRHVNVFKGIPILDYIKRGLTQRLSPTVSSPHSAEVLCPRRVDCCAIAYRSRDRHCPLTILSVTLWTMSHPFESSAVTNLLFRFDYLRYPFGESLFPLVDKYISHRRQHIFLQQRRKLTDVQL